MHPSSGVVAPAVLDANDPAPQFISPHVLSTPPRDYWPQLQGVHKSSQHIAGWSAMPPGWQSFFLHILSHPFADASI